MKKHHFLSLLVIFLIFTSSKSYAVPYPERIEWRAQPNEFVVSLYIGVLNRVQPDQNMINKLASRINSKPSSRLDLFWLFIRSNEYKATMYANQKKAYQVYYEYVNSGNSIMHRYYFAKQPSGADRSIKGSYNYGIAASIRDYYATYDKKSIEYGQLTTLVELGDLFDDYYDNSKGVNDPSESVTDRSGRTYKTVKIGNQIWMAENLAYEISGKQITDNTQWIRNNAYDGWCYYDNNNLSNGNTYGILYQWEAAKIACPIGWHLPTDTEWNTLVKYLIANGYNYDGTTSGEKIAKALAAKINWSFASKAGTPGNNPASNNSSGFCGLAAGMRGSNFNYPPGGRSKYVNWWSSTESETYSAWSRGLGYNTASVFRDDYGKKAGFCVRCVKD